MKFVNNNTFAIKLGLANILRLGIFTTSYVTIFFKRLRTLHFEGMTYLDGLKESPKIG